MARHRPKNRRPASARRTEALIHLREHEYLIETNDQFHDVQRRIRHARYALDTLLGGTVLHMGSPGDVESLLSSARELRQRYDDIEPRAVPPQIVDGHLVRVETPPMEENEFKDLLQRQIELWQEADLVLAQAYEAMASSVEGASMSVKHDVPEMDILTSLLQFHRAKRMDQSPPLRTYVFDLGQDEVFEVSFADSEPRRRRAEAWYDQTLESMSRVIDAQRKQKESDVLIRHTRIMTILTVIVVVLTAATVYLAVSGSGLCAK